MSLETSGIKIAMNRLMVHKLWGRKKPSYIDLVVETSLFLLSICLWCQCRLTNFTKDSSCTPEVF